MEIHQCKNIFSPNTIQASLNYCQWTPTKHNMVWNLHLWISKRQIKFFRINKGMSVCISLWSIRFNTSSWGPGKEGYCGKACANLIYVFNCCLINFLISTTLQWQIVNYSCDWNYSTPITNQVYSQNLQTFSCNE